MAVAVFLASVAVAMLPGIHSLQWTDQLPDGAVVLSCKGGYLTLPWNVTLEAGETIQNIEWFHESETSRNLIAMFAAGSFLPTPTYFLRLQHLGNAGLVVSQVTPDDAGNYSVVVVAHDAHDQVGKLSELHHSIEVDVASDPPVLQNGNFTVRQEPVAVYDRSTDDWKVALTCGTLTSRGHPPVDVMWTTPSGADVPSTSYSNGEFRLLLPNPVSGGTYTCHLPPQSLAATCLPKDSPLLTPASVDVDEIKARFSILEAELKDLRKKNENLTNYVGQLENKLNQTQLGSVDMVDSVPVTKDLYVSFHARLTSNSAVGHGDTLVLSDVISNEGGAYSGSRGVFTVPYNGTYFFTATASTSADASHADLTIAVNGNGISYLRSDEDVYNMGSCQVVVHLARGQQVQLISTGGANSYYHDTTTFGGFLVHADP